MSIQLSKHDTEMIREKGSSRTLLLLNWSKFIGDKKWKQHETIGDGALSL